MDEDKDDGEDDPAHEDHDATKLVDNEVSKAEGCHQADGGVVLLHLLHLSLRKQARIIIL